MRSLFYRFLLVFVFAGLWVSCSEDESNPVVVDPALEQEIYDYLAENNATIDYTNPNSYAPLLQDDIENSDVIFCGETHGIFYNRNIELSFLKYLNTNFSVRYFLLELGYGYGFLLNQYLQTGDEILLKDVLDQTKSTFYFSNERFEFWKNLYEYNQTLPEDKKIIVIGSDIEHQDWAAIWALTYLFPDGGFIPETIHPEMTALLKTYNNGSATYSELRSLSDDLYSSLLQYDDDYRSYFNDGYFAVSLIIRNLKERYDAYDKRNESTQAYWAARENRIYENFLNIYEHYPSGKYFGQWGKNHIYQARFNNIDWFAHRLQHYENSPVKDKVLSIANVYNNCKMMNIIDGEYGNPKDVTEGFGSFDMNYFDTYSNGEITLFRLNSENSPLTKKGILPELPNNAITDFMQYVILVRNSPAETPLE